MDQLSDSEYFYLVFKQAWANVLMWRGVTMISIFLSVIELLFLIAIIYIFSKEKSGKRKSKEKLKEDGTKIIITIVVFLLTLLWAFFDTSATIYNNKISDLVQKDKDFKKAKLELLRRPQNTKIQYQIINSASSETPEELQVRKDKIKLLQDLIDKSAPLYDDFFSEKTGVDLEPQVAQWFQLCLITLQTKIGNDKAIEFEQVLPQSNYTWPKITKDKEHDFYLLQARVVYLGDLKDKLEKYP